jgi:hypothetical protein
MKVIASIPFDTVSREARRTVRAEQVKFPRFVVKIFPTEKK